MSTRFWLLQIAVLAMLIGSQVAFASPFACVEAFAAPALDEKFLSYKQTKQVQTMIRDFKQKRAADQDVSSHELFQFAQARLQKFGFRTQLTTIELDEGEFKPVVEILSSPTDRKVGQIITAVQARFGTHFYIDPLLFNSRDGRGFFFGEKNLIVMDLRELSGDLNLPPAVLLHEIRHLYFHSTSGIKDSIYHGEINAFNDGKLESKGFYDDFCTLEELSTYFRDVKTVLTKFKNGSLKRSELARETEYMKRIGALVRKQLDALEQDLPAHLLIVVGAEDGSRYAVSYPIFTGEGDERRVTAVIHMDFSMPKDGVINEQLALQNLKSRLAKLKAQTDVIREFSEAVVRQLGP